MKEYACKKCGSVDVFIDDRGNQKALVCGDCGSWLKWIRNKELPLVERYIESNGVTNIDENSDIEIRVFNHKTDKVAYKKLLKSEATLLLNNIKLDFK